MSEPVQTITITCLLHQILLSGAVLFSFFLRSLQQTLFAVLFFSTLFMLENHCTQTAQSSRGGCSRRVHKIEYLAVNKANFVCLI